jgi:hypothetical protein
VALFFVGPLLKLLHLPLASTLTVLEHQAAGRGLTQEVVNRSTKPVQVANPLIADNQNGPLKNFLSIRVNR